MAVLIILILMNAAYSFSSHIQSATCTSPDIYHRIDDTDMDTDMGFRFRSQYEDEYSNPMEEQQDPCNHVSTVKVYCPYVPNPMTVGYTLSSTVCPNTRVSFYFIGKYVMDIINITSLHGSSFKADFKISELHLDNNGIAKIAPGAFNYQSTIDWISLRSNNLSTISVGIFNSLTHLQTLDLSENYIENISDDAFSSVPLTELLLSRNKLTSLPDALFDIRRLDLSHNKLEKISPSGIFEKRALNVSNNNIKYFNLTCFPKLEELYLANNKLAQIELLTSSMILKLDVSNNAISEYPENLESLVMLNIGGNEISYLPNKSIHGNALTELHLGGNKLTHIPSIFFKELSSLNILDLSGNKLSSFTFGTFDNLLSLTSLNISHNNFKTLPIYTLHAVKNLRDIYFNDNEITDINVEDLFKHLPLLKTVDFRGNRLSCQSLLDVVHKFKEHHIDFERGTFTDSDNIFGIKCNHTSEIREGTRTLYQDLGNSSFAKYLESLSRVPFAQNQQIVDRLLEMDKKQNDVLDQIVTRLNVSGMEQGTFQKNLLQNYSLGGADFAKQLKEIVNRTDTYKEMLARYSESSNVMQNISFDILEQDKKQNELLNKLISEQSKKVDMSKSIVYPSNNFTMMEKLISILNNTDQKQNEVVKVYSGLATDVKEVLGALEKTQISVGHFIEAVSRGNDSVLTLPDPDNTEKAEALHLYPGKTDSDGKNPVFIFIALLLTTMTILMCFLLYILFYRVKYIANTKPDVEMNQLLESKSDVASN
nr:unnamed protein product [Callosobruchus analis]